MAKLLFGWGSILWGFGYTPRPGRNGLAGYWADCLENRMIPVVIGRRTAKSVFLLFGIACVAISPHVNINNQREMLHAGIAVASLVARRKNDFAILLLSLLEDDR
jgi:hypothetical protein